MDKKRNKEKLNKWKEKLAFLKPWDMDDEAGEDLEIKEMSSSDNTRGSGWEGGKLSGEETEKRKKYAAGLAAALILLVAGGFYYYNGHHTFSGYVVTDTEECLDIVGTEYAMLGNKIIKYSSDGIFCTNVHNKTEWSVAYSMQTPIVDRCRDTMVIAEQQGNQVYVINSTGLMGNFETSRPILRADVSSQGVVALILDDEDVTWVELYDCSGSQLASIKTTLQESGYPLDAAITPGASRLMISFVTVDQGAVNSRISFYDFSSASDSDESHLTGSLDYPGCVFPEVFYADASTPVALSDTGFVVFKDSKIPQEKKKVVFEKEIVSSFHDEDYVGFVFNNEAEDCRFEMELYGYSGKRAIKKEFDCDYTEVKMDQGEILLYDAKNCIVYTVSGTNRFASDYEKQVEYFAKIPGFRKYLVITGDSMDHIRISD